MLHLAKAFLRSYAVAWPLKRTPEEPSDCSRTPHAGVTSGLHTGCDGTSPARFRPASLAALSSAASFCAAGTAPVFVLGLAELERQVGEGMGEPMQCEHCDPTSGDTLQHTTAGLAYYRATSNTPVFTDGWRHFALTARGVVTWEGASPDPPDYACHTLSSRERWSTCWSTRELGRVSEGPAVCRVGWRASTSRQPDE